MGTAEFHHEITAPLLPQAAAVFDDATTLDTAMDILDPEPTLVERLVGPVLLPCPLLAAGFLGRHEDVHLREREGQEAEIRSQPASRWQGRGRRVCNRPIMRTAARGVAQEEEEEEGIDQ